MTGELTSSAMQLSMQLWISDVSHNKTEPKRFGCTVMGNHANANKSWDICKVMHGYYYPGFN